MRVLHRVLKTLTVLAERPSDGQLPESIRLVPRATGDVTAVATDGSILLAVTSSRRSETETAGHVESGEQVVDLPVAALDTINRIRLPRRSDDEVDVAVIGGPDGSDTRVCASLVVGSQRVEGSAPFVTQRFPDWERLLRPVGDVQADMTISLPVLERVCELLRGLTTGSGSTVGLTVDLTLGGVPCVRFTCAPPALGIVRVEGVVAALPPRGPAGDADPTV